jgi:5-dehydro-4-deoxyglucarate dehydratase
MRLSRARALLDRLDYRSSRASGEILARQRLATGMESDSSAVFGFLPRFATLFYRALCDKQHDRASSMVNDLYSPLIALRQRKRGYAVGIIKAGRCAVGTPAGAR